MVTCPSCGTENAETNKFCPECATMLHAAPLREERKVITALFCDLVGSTALGERLDAEDISRLLRSYQEICRRRIESHGGVVEKFIGDAVVGVFGVPLAHEDDPERAVRAALRITEDVGASDLGIEVRIGVNTGEALVRLDVDPRSGEGFATGDTMNTAARLEAAAPVMGVAVGDATHQASAEAIVYEELPAISAKGKAEPVAAWRALHPTARIGTSERDRTPFLGREPELMMLTRLFERSRTRPATEFCTIIAEPGLGKSRLVRELSRHVDALPELVTWREGRCLPYGEGISFWALGEIVKAQAGILETDDRETLSSKLDRVVTEPDPQTKAWIIDRLAPLVGLETDTSPPQQEEAFTAWRRFLESLAAAGPTVLVVEDLHWADPGFVAFLSYLSERTAGLPLLVVATARPELEERHPSWPPGRRSTVLSLSPLEDQDLEALITSTLGDASSELTAIVLERAGGSPLYAEQLAAMFTERAMPISGGALDETQIPQSVQALIAARIDALPPEPKRVLMEASVVGKTFWAGVVGAMGEHPDLETTLGDLVRREFCRPMHPSTMEGDSEFGFWHALVRDVAYAELTRAERARMHIATALWIEQVAHDRLTDFADVLVYHTRQALDLAPAVGTTDDDEDRSELEARLRRYLVAAGDRAMSMNATRALEMYRSALDVWPPSDDGRAYALVKMARAALEVGLFDEARSMYEEALRELNDRGDPRAAGGAALGLAGVLVRLRLPHRDLVDEAIGLLEEGPPGPDLVRAYSFKGGAVWFEGDPQGLNWAERSIKLAEELGLESSLPEPLGLRGSIRADEGDHQGGIADLREALAIATRAGLGMTAFMCYNNLAFVLSKTEGSRASLAIIEEATKWSDEHGLVAGSKWNKLTELDGRQCMGDWSGFLSAVDELLGSVTSVDEPALKALAQSLKAYVLTNMGIEGSPQSLSREAVVATRVEEPHPTELQEVLRTAAVVANMSGEPQAASAIIKEIIANETKFGWPVELIYVPDLFRIANDEDLDLLEGAVRRRTPKYRDDEAAMASCHGILAERHGELQQAAERFAAAAELWAPFSSFEHGQALLGSGRCGLGVGVEGATKSVEEARAVFARLGARPSLDEAERLLAAPPHRSVQPPGVQP